MRNKFLKTYQLTTEIINLISSTKSYCYIISPYIKIWPQLDRVLNEASAKRIFLTFVIREDPKSNYLIEKLNKEYGFEVIIIKDLHIKLYLNESKCLLSTMNLYDASQQNNLELGFEIPDSKNVKKDIIETYILADSTAKVYKGKFDSDRIELLENVKKAKNILIQNGFCVECDASIIADFNPWNPNKIRCYECYSNSRDLSLKIKFCHYCGKKLESRSKIPFHNECEEQIKVYWKMTKDYK